MIICEPKKGNRKTRKHLHFRFNKKKYQNDDNHVKLIELRMNTTWEGMRTDHSDRKQNHKVGTVWAK